LFKKWIEMKKKKYILVPVLLSFVILSCEQQPKVNDEDTSATTSAPSDSQQSEMVPPADTSGMQTMQTTLSPEDFIMKANEGHLFEIKASEVAAKKSKNKEVKNFSGMIVKHHGEAKKQLQKITESSKVKLTDSLSEEKKQNLKDIEALSGPEFDKEYIRLMTEAHKNDSAFYSEASQKIQDTALLKYA
jgi:putative membrane protein